jgi:hypothetical protein
MGKRKAKIIIDEKKSKQKRAIRIPRSKPDEVFPDRTKYNRKDKYKRSLEE